MGGPPEIDVFEIAPPSSRELERILARGRRKTRATGCAVGLLSGGLGALMLALIGLELDPEVAHMPLAGKVVGVGFGLLFGVVGLGMIGLAVLGRGGGSTALARRFERAPDSIVRARRVVSTSRGMVDPGRPGQLGQHTVVVTADDDSEVRVMMSDDDVGQVLRWVAARVPHARVEGL